MHDNISVPCYHPIAQIDLEKINYLISFFFFCLTYFYVFIYLTPRSWLMCHPTASYIIPTFLPQYQLLQLFYSLHIFFHFIKTTRSKHNGTQNYHRHWSFQRSIPPQPQPLSNLRTPLTKKQASASQSQNTSSPPLKATTSSSSHEASSPSKP